MIYVNIIIVVFSVALAIISRKHYSKYKGKRGMSGLFYMLGMAMGHRVYQWVKGVGIQGIEHKISGMLRKNQIVAPKRLELITEEFMARCFAVAIGILFFFNALDLGSRIAYMVPRDGDNIIEREEYSGDVLEEEIYYELDGRQQTLVLNVSPVRLTEMEFREKADVVASSVAKECFPEGILIEEDIELPVSADGGAFSISWLSKDPKVLSSKGRVKLDDLKESREVGLIMTISYYDYSAEYEFSVLVGEREKSNKQLVTEGLEQALYNLEQETVEEAQLLLPDKVNDIKVSTRKNENGGRYLLLGIVLCMVAIGIILCELKGSSDKRDTELMREYPYFVDSIWLYIEAGMNIRRALFEYVDSSKKRHGIIKNRRTNNILTKEISYTLHEIDNGQTEYLAYEELGERLCLSPYKSIMRHISQNLRMGTKDLKGLMETEVNMALEAKKENAKRLGEEASTKLVFPMIILLVVVMVLIMTPAFMGF